MSNFSPNAIESRIFEALVLDRGVIVWWNIMVVASHRVPLHSVVRRNRQYQPASPRGKNFEMAGWAPASNEDYVTALIRCVLQWTDCVQAPDRPRYRQALLDLTKNASAYQYSH